VSTRPQLPCPKWPRTILDEYLERERPAARFDEPLFLVRYKKWPGEWQVRRMDSHRVWKLIKDTGRRAGVPELQPHAFRHACGVELLKRNGGNLRVVTVRRRYPEVRPEDGANRGRVPARGLGGDLASL
jgi:integrase